MRQTRLRRLAAASALALLLGACSSGDDGPEGDGGSSTAEPTATGTEQPDASGSLSDEVVAIGDTVRIGLINMEDSPLLSAPEIRQAAEAAVEYVNAELDGIGGVPIELVSCVVTSAEDAQRCTQEMAADDTIVSVINGVNAFNAFFDFYGMLGGKPVVGGVPLVESDFNEPTARFFFGGALSAFTGIGRFVVEELGAETVGVLYGQNAAGESSRQAIDTIFQATGVDATYVPVPTPSTDVTPQVTQVAQDFDAVVVITAAAECAPVMIAVAQLGIAPETVVYTGTCNDEESMGRGGSEAIGSWMHFTLYGNDQTNVPADKVAETELTAYIYDTYGDDIVAGGLAVLGLNSVLNIQALYEEIGLDNLSPATIIATMDDGTPRPSHSGTDWVCDNPAFTSVCNADNFFAPITADLAYTIGEPVNGLALLAELAAAGG